MSKEKLDKNDKKYIIITLVIGGILQIFIDSGMDISLLVFFIYISHKYIGSVENINEYNSYEFIDKDKFVKGKKRFVLLMDLYFISRIIYNFTNPHSSYVFAEMLLILIIAYIPYENYLTKKYVLNTNSTKEKKKLVFVKNKLVVSIILLALTGFTYLTFNTLNELSTSNYAKYGNYKYNLTNENEYRKIELKIGSHYMMVEENEKNSKYFDDYLRLGKDLLKDKIFKSYMNIIMLTMLALCFIELYPNKNTVNSILSNVFLIIFLISSIFVFSFETFDKEDELTSYFHKYLNR